MTAHPKLLRADRYIADATDLLEAGFRTKADRRALVAVGRAYGLIRDITHERVIEIAREAISGWNGGSDKNWQAYVGVLNAHELPHTLNQVKDIHFERVAGIPAFAPVRDLIALRAAINVAEIIPVERHPHAEKAEAVHRSIIEEMERRKTQHVDGLDMADRLGGLPVRVNAHMVTNDKGRTFVRHFFYLSGKLTPLNTIIAIAEQLEKGRKKEAQ